VAVFTEDIEDRIGVGELAGATSGSLSDAASALAIATIT
jgi:hypothetical protein